MSEKSNTHYEQQLWQLADLYDILQLFEASETLIDYAAYVVPLHLRLTTIADKRDFKIPSIEVPDASKLSQNLTSILGASCNTGTLVIDYVDHADGYKEGFLPVMLDIRQGEIVATPAKSGSHLKFESRDLKPTGGISRALTGTYEAGASLKQTLVPDIFRHMSKIIPAYKNHQAPS